MLSAVHASWRNIGKMVESSRIEEKAISDQLFNSDLCNAKKFRNGKAPCVLRRPLAFSLFLKLRKLPCLLQESAEQIVATSPLGRAPPTERETNMFSHLIAQSLLT